MSEKSSNFAAAKIEKKTGIMEKDGGWHWQESGTAWKGVGIYHVTLTVPSREPLLGRLETRYDYSIKIVYNYFPWPVPTDEQKAKIEQTAQAILDARALYPDSSLADLYDELTMPVELRRAHQENDRAVMAAYGFKIGMTESQCVAELFKMYQELTK